MTETIPWAKTSLMDVHHAPAVGADSACGRPGPFATRWEFVSCEACLVAGPDDPVVRARLAEVEAERKRGGG